MLTPQLSSLGDPLCLMTIHAHPDDEASKGAPTVAKYFAEGVRTVLVCCTGGEEGDLQNPALREPGQPFHDMTPEQERAHLAIVRPEELRKSVEAIGFSSLHMLGYRDSGMAGSESNNNPDCFHMSDLDEAAGRLVRLIRLERPHVILTYNDDQASYPHPDHLRVHDALTGLPNRVLFERKTTEALERSRTTHSSVAVLFIDLDKLKHVNDTIGHAVGDQLIVTVARRLAAATRPSDLVARISGDEFVVLCEGLLDEQVALDVAERIRTSITGPLVLQGVEIEAGASIGVAMSTPELLNTESAADAAVTLLRSADTAMYRAKQRGRGRSELYSEDMRTAAKARQTLASELEQALAGNQFAVVFQPIESAHTGRVVAAEALLRWNHPTRGMHRCLQ